MKQEQYQDNRTYSYWNQRSWEQRLKKTHKPRLIMSSLLLHLLLRAAQFTVDRHNIFGFGCAYHLPKHWHFRISQVVTGSFQQPGLEEASNKFRGI